MDKLELKHGIRGAVKGLVLAGTITAIGTTMFDKNQKHTPFIKDEVKTYNCTTTEYAIDSVVEGALKVVKSEPTKKYVSKAEYRKLKSVTLETYLPWIEEARRNTCTYSREIKHYSFEDLDAEQIQSMLESFYKGDIESFAKDYDDVDFSIEQHPILLTDQQIANKTSSAYLTVNEIDYNDEKIRRQTIDENLEESAYSSLFALAAAAFGSIIGSATAYTKENKRDAKRMAKELKKQ